MKRYAVADEVPEVVTWLTAGKEYPADKDLNRGDGYWVNDDEGDHVLIRADGCAFLGGKSWRIVEREE